MAGAQDDTPLDPDAFNRWLSDFKSEAQSKGINTSVLDSAFANTQPMDEIIELDRKQPESTITIDEYLSKTVNEKRIQQGREAMQDNRELLESVAKKYGVQPRFIVALWGIETNFGGYTGGYRTVDALATLAFDGRRSDYFRGELINALKIIQQEDMNPDDLQGSWAGALGQCQFMPTTFLEYAADFDGDGHHDIWNNPADVFASVANYLDSLGWNDREGWGRAVQVPESFSHTRDDIKSTKTLAQWQKLGVRNADGSDLPDASIAASLVLVGKDDAAQPYLIYDNYKSLLKWNRSRYFATAVGTLADAIDAK